MFRQINLPAKILYLGRDKILVLKTMNKVTPPLHNIVLLLGLCNFILVKNAMAQLATGNNATAKLIMIAADSNSLPDLKLETRLDSIVYLPGTRLSPETMSLVLSGPSNVTIADGTSFEAAHGYLATVRVGQFTVEQVECIVLPAEFKAAPALLGTSFLRSFIFRVNPDSRSLSLSRIEEASGPAKKK